MSETRLSGRIVNKHDTEANWKKATNFVPMIGELIVYDADEVYGYERTKIGDGKTNVNDLPFEVSALTTEEIDAVIGTSLIDAMAVMY